MKGGREQSKLAAFWGKHGIRYRWLTTWPPFPVRLAWDDPGPPHSPAEQRVWTMKMGDDGTIQRSEEVVEIPANVPSWVNEIAERIWEILLPLIKGVSLNHYEAAMIGYWHSAAKRECDHHRNVWGTVVSAEERLGRGEIVNQLNHIIALCENKKAEMEAQQPARDAVDWLKGFDYGVECQQREVGFIPSSQSSKTAKLVTENVKTYEALFRNWKTVGLWTKERKTSRQMGESLLKMLAMDNGTTYASYYEKNPDAKETWFENFQQLCGRIGLELPGRGRPRRVGDVG